MATTKALELAQLADNISFDESGNIFIVDGVTSTNSLRVGSVYNLGATPPAVSIVYSSAGRTYDINSSTEFFVERSTTAYMSIIGNSSSIINFGDSSSETKGKISYVPTANYMAFSTNETEKLRIDSAGNVGIGTTSPSAALDVVGGAKVSGAVTASDMFITGPTPVLTLTDDDVADETTQILNSSGNTFIDSRNGTSDGQFIVRGKGGGVVTEHFRANANGVGIFNSSPTAPLDVNGNAKISGNLTVDTSTLHVDSTNNRVGVGTTSPSTTLDVVGTIRGTADATLNGLTVGRGVGNLSNNTVVGLQALQSTITGTFNTAVGRQALRDNTTGDENTAYGYQALLVNVGGNSNSALGYRTLFANTSGNNNTAVGLQALQANTAGSGNVAVGANALQGNDTGNFNTAVGRQALAANDTGNENTAQGYQALLSNIGGTANTAQGYQALRDNISGNNNTAVGRRALLSNITGANNTAQGYQALQSNLTGTNNTAYGFQALLDTTEGIENSALGAQALRDVSTGSGNIGLGFRTAGATYSPVYNVTAADNRIVMGHTGITNAYVQVAWTIVSDARDKAAFAPVPHGLDFVNSLKPTEYQFKENGRDGEADGIKRYGFLAQDVLELEGDNPVIVDTEDLDKLKLKESNLIPVLVNAIQELTAEVQTLKAKLEAK